MVATEEFGTAADGGAAHIYTLSSPTVTVRLSDFGATILGISCVDAAGREADVVLGFDTLEGYAGANPACYGATIGPVANRTDGASLEIGGETWHLAANEGPNNLHTDLARGLHKRLWAARVDEDADRVTFTCELASGELGLPGGRTFSAVYELGGDGALSLSYRCETDRATFVNMTNHTYFNLAGHASGDISGQRVRVNASHYLPVREDSVSEGTLADVDGTPFDLRGGSSFGERLAAKHPQLARGRGFDHCLCIDGYEPGAAPRCALTAWDPASGRTLAIDITQPGAHLYTGNWLDDTGAKDGASYRPRSGFAFEPEFYPDGVHHPSWPQPVCTPGHPYEAKIVYRFGIAGDGADPLP